MEIVYLFIIIGFCYLIRLLGKSIESMKYPHKKCPFCGSDVSGHNGYVSINGDSFINYKCSRCGAHNNRSSSIWYRKESNTKDDFETEMKTGN